MLPYLIKECGQGSRSRKEAEELMEAIENFIAAGRLDMITGFCNCCLYKIFDKALLVSECPQCRIHHAKIRMSNAGALVTGLNDTMPA